MEEVVKKTLQSYGKKRKQTNKYIYDLKICDYDLFTIYLMIETFSDYSGDGFIFLHELQEFIELDLIKISVEIIL